MDQWEGFLLAAIGATVVFSVQQFLGAPKELRKQVDELSGRVNKLDSQMQIVQETRLTEAQVKSIVHEQLKPLQDDMREMKDDIKFLIRTLSNSKKDADS